MTATLDLLRKPTTTGDVRVRVGKKRYGVPGGSQARVVKEGRLAWVLVPDGGIHALTNAGQVAPIPPPSYRTSFERRISNTIKKNFTLRAWATFDPRPVATKQEFGSRGRFLSASPKQSPFPTTLSFRLRRGRPRHRGSASAPGCGASSTGRWTHGRSSHCRRACRHFGQY